MPFSLTPAEVTTRDAETIIRGRLRTGAYFGPEAVVIHASDGRECTTHVHSHGMESPEGWPVLPEHLKTVVVLRVPRLPDGFVPVLVTGVGSVQTGQERVDVSECLAEPEFWAFQVALHCASDEVEDPALAFLGIPPDVAERWYRRSIEEVQAAAKWPYVRVPLPDSRYIELEMAAGVEYQDRIWLGHLSGSRRVLLGYHSGHFSLPALRLAEVEWVATQSAYHASALLWLSATYLEAGQYPLALTRELVSHVPGIRAGQVELMANTLLERLLVQGLRWSPDPQLGWINNWQCSQRNPGSQLSTLKPPDFAYLRGFFS